MMLPVDSHSMLSGGHSSNGPEAGTCYRDYTDVLATIDVPVLVVSCDSGIFPASVKQGEWIASQIPQGKFVPFYEGGHMLFYLEAEKFNKTVDEFAAGLLK